MNKALTCVTAFLILALVISVANEFKLKSKIRTLESAWPNITFIPLPKPSMTATPTPEPCPTPTPKPLMVITFEAGKIYEIIIKEK